MKSKAVLIAVLLSATGSSSCNENLVSSDVTATINVPGVSSEIVDGDPLYKITLGELKGRKLTRVNPVNGVGNQKFSGAKVLCSNLKYGSEENWQTLDSNQAAMLKKYELSLLSDFQTPAWVGVHGNDLGDAQLKLDDHIDYLCHWKYVMNESCTHGDPKASLPKACSKYKPRQTNGSSNGNCGSFKVFLKSYHSMAPKSYPNPDTLDKDIDETDSQIKSLGKIMDDKDEVAKSNYFKAFGTYDFVLSKLSNADHPQTAGVICVK